MKKTGPRQMKRSMQVHVRQAKSELSRLLAEVEKGCEVIIARDGTPVARLVPFHRAARRELRTGDWKGRITIAPDFDAMSERSSPTAGRRAQLERATLVSADPQILAYDVKTIDARK
jgi:prevent-host-death family protein